MPETIPSTPEQERARLEGIAIVLDATGDVLETEGWIRGTYVSRNGYCALGAMRKACGVLGPDGYLNDAAQDPAVIAKYNDAKREMERCLEASGQVGIYARVHNWNDHPEQTKEGVVRGFRNCASRVRDQAEALR